MAIGGLYGIGRLVVVSTTGHEVICSIDPVAATITNACVGSVGL